MANYAPSVLAVAQATLATKYNEAELRRKMRPALSLAIKNQEYSIPDHLALRTADARPVDVMYFTRKSAGASTAKVARHTGTKGTSAKITLAFVRFAETFKVSRKQAQNNVFGIQEMFNNETEQAILSLKDRAETSAIAHLVANRTQLASLTTSGAGTWNATNFALEVAAGNKDFFIQHAKSFMNGRLYKGDFDFIVDLTAFRTIERIANQGGGNSTNLGFQIIGVNSVPTVDTILSAYTLGSGIIMPAGTFAGLVWNDPENRKNVTVDGYVGMLGTLLDPFGDGIVFDVSTYADRSDESAVGGHAQDIKDEWEISLTIGWALAPLSTASDSSVHVIGQV